MNIKILENILLFVKIIIIILLVSELHYHFIGKDLDKQNLKIIYWEKRMNFIFTILIAFLLLYLFLPGTNAKINNSTKFTLLLFAIVLLIKADWTHFITDSLLFKKIYDK